MFFPHEMDVLVVGAGPVGLFSALLLSKLGIRCTIIEQESRPAARSYGCVLHPSTLDLFDRIGLAEEVIAAGRKVERLAVYEGAERVGEVALQNLPIRHPFWLVLPQSELESLLLSHLPGPGVCWNYRLDELEPGENRVRAIVERLGQTGQGYGVADFEWTVVNRRSINAVFVIGADGITSRVRQSLSTEYIRLTSPEFFNVYEFTSNHELGAEARLILTEGSIAAVWPMLGKRVRWSVPVKLAEPFFPLRTKERVAWSIAEDMVEPTSLGIINDFIQRSAPWFRGAVEEVAWHDLVGFEQHLVSSWGNGRVWLVGDAAHQTFPLGVQSMNVGFTEAESLVEKLAAVLRDNAPLELLSGYGENCAAEWGHLLGQTARLIPRDQAAAWTHRYSQELLSSLPAAGDLLTELAPQLGFTFATLVPQTS